MASYRIKEAVINDTASAFFIEYARADERETRWVTDPDAYYESLDEAKKAVYELKQKAAFRAAINLGRTATPENGHCPVKYHEI